VAPICPHIDVAPGREVALLLGVVFRLPLGRQPADHRRRQVRSVLAQKSRQDLLEVAGRNATQIQNRKQSPERYRYAFFCSPKFPELRRRSEPEGGGAVQVWSVAL
jgi:hypothetical protein